MLVCFCNFIICCYYFITAHGISLISSSHVTTTVWLSDRHLSLFSRCYSRRWQSPWRVQSCSLCQHGRSTDALPTGRPEQHKRFRLSWKMVTQHILKGDIWLVSRWKCTGGCDFFFFVCNMHTHMDLLAASSHQTCWETVCACVWCVLVVGGRG